MKMKLQNRILLPVLGLVFAGLLIMSILVDRTVRRQSERTLKDTVAAKVAAIEAGQRNIEEYCMSHAVLFTQDATVQKAYAIAHSGDMNAADDPKAQEARALLLQEFAPVAEGFKQQMQGRTYSLHFHLPTCRSLIRIWKKNQAVSDDLSSFRQTVLDIGSGNHDPITGIEVGVGGFVIRGIAPVKSPSGDYLGSIEMLSDYMPLVLSAKTNDKQNFGVFMNIDLLHLADKLADPAKNPRIDDEYVLTASTNQELVMGLLDGNLLNAGKSELKTVLRDGFQVTVFPVLGYDGGQIGVISYILDYSEEMGQLAAMRWGIFIGTGILLILTSFIVVLIVRSMVKSLNGIIGGLTNGAEQVASSAGEVSSASRSLAEGATEQAAGLEETSSSLEEMSSMTKQNADNAQQANRLASEARDAAEQGAKAMARMSEAIDGIQKSSDETRKILKVIDEIAFQTNLLALNAAVEAARAGEAGKGFAVVAEEVRNLAMRSAEAAKNTANMIEESVKNSKNGVAISDEVSQALQAIVGSVSKTTDLVGEIAAASQEQAQGIEQVNTAVSQMDKITQQNAANAEESASASEEMTAQAEQLKSIVGELTRLVQGASAARNNSGGSERYQASQSAPWHSDELFHQIAADRTGVSRNDVTNPLRSIPQD